jgi:hypothetical protein
VNRRDSLSELKELKASLAGFDLEQLYYNCPVKFLHWEVVRKKRTGDLETNLEPSILQELYPGETLEPWVKTTHLYDIG